MSATSGSDRLDQVRRRALSADGGTPSFFTSDIGGAPHWVSGLLAGLQGALLSLLVVVLPAVTAYVVTAADPTNAGVSWTRSARFGGGMWLLAHGVPLTVDGAVMTIVPLGLTVLAVFTCHVSARRSGQPTTLALAAGVAGYTSVAVVVSLLVGGSLAHVALATGGAVVVSALGLSTGLARRPAGPSLRELTRPVWARVPAPARTGAVAGVLATALLVLAASLVTLTWVLSGAATIGGLVEALGLDAIGGGLLAVTELAFVPNLVVLALAWLAGPGFQVGTGTTFSTSEVVSGPLPAIPLLGALPQPDGAGGLLVAMPLVLVAAGAVAAAWMRRRRPVRAWTDPLTATLACAVTSGVLVGGLVGLASGAIGPGRMADVGGSPWVVGSVVGAGVLVGALLVALPADAAFRGEVRLALRRTVAGGRGGSRAADPRGAAPQSSATGPLPRV